MIAIVEFLVTESAGSDNGLMIKTLLLPPEISLDCGDQMK